MLPKFGRPPFGGAIVLLKRWASPSPEICSTEILYPEILPGDTSCPSSPPITRQLTSSPAGCVVREVRAAQAHLSTGRPHLYGRHTLPRQRHTSKTKPFDVGFALVPCFATKGDGGLEGAWECRRRSLRE